MRFLTLGEVLEIQRMVAGSKERSVAVRDLPALESAVAQPQATFEGQLLYPSLPEQAAALCFSLVENHPFLDGNKRTAHAGGPGQWCSRLSGTAGDPGGGQPGVDGDVLARVPVLAPAPAHGRGSAVGSATQPGGA